MVAAGRIMTAISSIVGALASAYTALAVAKQFATNHPIAAAAIAAGVVAAVTAATYGVWRAVSALGAELEKANAELDRAEAAAEKARARQRDAESAARRAAAEKAQADALVRMYKQLAGVEKSLARDEMNQYQRRIAELKEEREQVQKLIDTMLRAEAAAPTSSAEFARRFGALVDRGEAINRRIEAAIKKQLNAEATAASVEAGREAVQSYRERLRRRAEATGESEEMAAMRMRYERYLRTPTGRAKPIDFRRFVEAVSEGAKTVRDIVNGLAYGTANPAALQSLQMRGGDGQEKQLTELIAVHKGIDRLVEEAKRGGATFD